MAYITADEVKAIREALKKRFPECKFSVRKGDGGYSVKVSVLDSPHGFEGVRKPYGYVDINPFWYEKDEGLTGPEKEFIGEIIRIVKTAPETVSGRRWYNRSDSQTDYFDTAYYFDISIGRDDDHPYRPWVE